MWIHLSVLCVLNRLVLTNLLIDNYGSPSLCMNYNENHWNYLLRLEVSIFIQLYDLSRITWHVDGNTILFTELIKFALSFKITMMKRLKRIYGLFVFLSLNLVIHSFLLEFLPFLNNFYWFIVYQFDSCLSHWNNLRVSTFSTFLITNSFWLFYLIKE